VRKERLDCSLAFAEQQGQLTRLPEIIDRRPSVIITNSIRSAACPAISSMQWPYTFADTSETELASSPGWGMSGASKARTFEASPLPFENASVWSTPQQRPS
jgi:hypothetical protein